MSRTSVLHAALLGGAVLGGASTAGASGLCDAVAARKGASAYVALVSVFPAEVAPLLARTTVREEIDVNGRVFRVGELAGVRVVLGLTGIGAVNARTTTESLLPRYDFAALVMSGVAGGLRRSLRIGDIVVPARWLEIQTGAVFDSNPALRELAREVAGGLRLEHCTPVPPSPAICFRHRPAMFVGGLGQTNDPSGVAIPCLPQDGDIFGCDVPGAAARAEREDSPLSVDMETAAVARAAAGHGVPMVALRALSDGGDDPLHLHGFLQFFRYYALAARNAATGTRVLLRRIARVGDGRHRNRALCRLLARGRWKQAARVLRARRHSG